MSGYTVHTIPGSPFGRAVLIALEEKGAPYSTVTCTTWHACATRASLRGC